MPPSLVLITMTEYHNRFQVLHQRSLNLLQIEPDISLITSVKPVPLEGFSLQFTDEAILFRLPSP